MKTYLELEDVESMERVATCLRDELLIRLLFRLACRISEALAIYVGDVDFARGTITILHLKRRAKLSCLKCRARLGKRHRFCPECGGEISATATRQMEHRRVRTLPLDRDTLNMLADFIETEARTNLIFDINRHRAWQIVRDCARRAGLPNLVNPETGSVRGVSPHRLRDAFSVHAMKLDDSGDALRLLQEHLGHASFNTTAKYRKVAGEEHRRWYNHLWVEII
ncbi:MAG: tyrosine-type recombinase/integrase [Dehalococcoidales bacterium]|nr:tyrosine-type recombinase/integrase [Dehalococcoidales bacterium]